MNALPSGLADPLHILEPFPLKVVLATLAALAYLLYRLYRRYRRRRSAAVTPTPAGPPSVRAGGILSLVEDIHRTYRATGDFRQGCHELARALRTHFHGRHPFETLTAREVEEAVGDTTLSRLFALLAQLQFARRAPTASDFDGITDLTREVVGPKSR